jgi:ABC-type molybdate transport system substrate-binding protein
VVFGAATSATPRNRAGAAELVKFLRGSAARDVMRKQGLEPVSQ